VPRPARLPADLRRADILAVSAKCFSSHGFVGTTTRDIAKACHLTEAALYRHFPSKEAIYTAILDERLATGDFVTPFARAASEGDDLEVFGGLAHALLEAVERDSTFLRLMLFSALEGHQLARPFQEKRVRPLRDFLADYIEGRIRSGAFRKIDPVLAARAFIGMVIDHLIVREIFGQRAEYPQTNAEVVQAFVSIFLGGVRRSEVQTKGAAARPKRRSSRRSPHG
jgi:AcrR family transcriptional regulator